MVENVTSMLEQPAANTAARRATAPGLRILQAMACLLAGMAVMT
jgi:nicotinate-nucleotide pyrophosphorylase